MDLSMGDAAAFSRYKSAAQLARVLSEGWFEREMYCPACLADRLERFPPNRKAVDFFCAECGNRFQSKASGRGFGRRVVDGAYETMLRFIQANQNPTFFFLHYSPEEWEVVDLTMVPRFFVSTSFLEERKPLPEGTRRAGWKGCNLRLDRIPEEGKIGVVEEGKERPRKKVNREWKRMAFLEEKRPESRGWTADVLKCVEEIGKKRFSLKNVYSFEGRLQELHPDNRHVKAKIRQQLQVLRDQGLLEFLGGGIYRRKQKVASLEI